MIINAYIYIILYLFELDMQYTACIWDLTQTQVMWPHVWCELVEQAPTKKEGLWWVLIDFFGIGGDVSLDCWIPNWLTL